MTISLGIASPLLDIGTTNNDDQPSAAEISSADKRFQDLIAAGDNAKDTLSEITQGGTASYWAWKMKQLKEQITDQVMTSMNLTPDKIAAMDAKERVATENKIEQMVEQQLKLQISEDMRRKHQSTLAVNASMQSVVTMAQGVDPLASS